MSKITPELLKAIAPGTKAELRDRFLPALNLALPLYGIDTKLEVDGFLTTSCFESDHFKTMREYGHGAGRAYGKPDKITGLVYYGRGIFQNTWKKGYQAFTNYVKAHWAFIQPRVGIAEPPNFVMEPELLATVFWAVEAACWYWEENHLAKYARQGLDGFFALQGLVNRGSASKEALDYDERLAIYKKALTVTPDDFKLDAAASETPQTNLRQGVSDTPPEPAKPVAEKPLLKMGDEGPDVVRLQEMLNLSSRDGVFTEHEKYFVKEFQEARSLTVDGIVGEETWAALEAAQNPYAYPPFPQYALDGASAAGGPLPEDQTFIDPNMHINAQRLNDLQHDVDGLDAEGSAGKPEPPPDVTVRAATMTWEQRIAAVGAFLASIGISIRDGFSNPYVLIAIGVFALIAYLIFRHAQKDKQERTLKYIDNALDPKTGNLTVV